MGIKGRIVCLIIMIALIGTAAAVPSWVMARVQTVEIVQANYESYQKSVICTGILKMSRVREVYIPTAVVPQMVNVRPGDYVTAGQTLAVMDQDTSRQVASVYRPVGITDVQNSDISQLPEEYLALAQTFGISGEALSSLLEQYGSSPGQTEKKIFLDEEGEGEQQPEAIPSEIIAPISGMITQVSMEEGVMFTPESAAFTIGENSGYVAQINIPENALSNVEAGMTVSITGNGLGDKNYHGYVNCIYPVAQKHLSGTTVETVVQAEVILIDADDGILPGLTVEAEIILEEPKQLLTLPYEAIGQDEENREFVYIIQEGKPKKQYIVTGQELSSRVQIIDGLALEDIVIYQPEFSELESPIFIKKVEGE